MNRRTLKVVAEFCGLALTVFFATFFATPAYAQAPEAKEKPPMYSYVSFWTLPRAQWGELEKKTWLTRRYWRRPSPLELLWAMATTQI